MTKHRSKECAYAGCKRLTKKVYCYWHDKSNPDIRPKVKR